MNFFAIGKLAFLNAGSRVTWVKVKGYMGQGQRSTLNVKVKITRPKMLFQVSLDRLTGNVQGSRSKVTWVKVKVQVGLSLV